MSEQHDVTRWRDGGAPIPGLDEALVAYSEQGASDAEVERLQAALAPQLARPTVSGTLKWWSVARLGAWISIALLGSTAIWKISSRDDAPEPAPEPRVAARAPLVVAAPRIAEPAAAPQDVLVDAPVDPSPAPSPAARARARAKQAPSALADAPVLSIEAELELLRRAQGALNRSARTVLALAEEHEQLYPQGAFIEEREMLRIEAELAVGRRVSALKRAKAFSERFGRSTYSARIERLIAAHDALKSQESTPADRTQ